MLYIFGVAISQTVIESFIVGFWLGLQFGTVWLVLAQEEPQNANLPNPPAAIPALENSAQLIDVLKHLSTTHRSLHAQRMKQEFSFTITILGLYVAVAGASLQYENAFFTLAPELRLLIGVAILLSAAGSIGYFWSSARSNDINQRMAQDAEGVLIAMVRTQVQQFIPRPMRNPSRYRWLLWATAVMLGAVVSALLIIRRAEQKTSVEGATEPRVESPFAL